MKIVQTFLLIVSYWFYMSWDWRFAFLIGISTIIDYILAIKIHDSENSSHRKIYLNISLVTNLFFILGFFKYYNFLADSLNLAWSSIGLSQPLFPILNIILPVGISFYTFQSLSYTIDVYRKVIQPEKSIIQFALFVSFFPQLVAGPIVTAKIFLPQLQSLKKWEEIPFRMVARYFMMGYIKKVVMSDNISPIADLIFANPQDYGTEGVWLGAMLFHLQIYCDFSGYTDMAYASALALGFHLPENFRMPFIARSFGEFWRRWHMTLGSWLRDYLYFSLGGNQLGLWRTRFNLWFTMLVGGIWHGASWTFAIWGSIQGFMIVWENILNKYLDRFSIWHKFNESKLGFFMGLIYLNFASIVINTCFRAESISKEWIHLQRMFQYYPGSVRPYMYKTGFLVLGLFVLGHILGYWIFEKGKKKEISPIWEVSLYPICILILAYLTPDAEIPFVYFQF